MRHYPITVVKRRGFTALELIIVLVVGFSIIALSASKMGQLFSASTTTAAMGTILDLFTAARSLRGAEHYGASNADLMEALTQAKMVPQGLVIVGGRAVNEWRGAIKIEPYYKGDGIGFDLSYEKVPGEACAKIAQNLLRSGNFTEIKIGALPAKSDTPPLEVITACAGAVDDQGNLKEGGVTMVFKFRE